MQEEQKINSPFNNPLVRFLTAAKFRWIRHTLFLLMGLLLAYKGDLSPGQRPPDIYEAILKLDGSTYLFIMTILYVMMYYFVPKTLFKSKIIPFILSFLLCISLIYVGVFLMELWIMKPIHVKYPRMTRFVQFRFIDYIEVAAVGSVLVGAVVGLQVFKKWIVDVERMNAIQRLTLKAELEQLKSQVNPHFLFNTLNNLLVLVKTDANKASQVLLGLSDLLRYQLYDSAQDKILLTKDIAFIDNLLSLEKIRKDDFEFLIKTSGEMESIRLPPFLFIPFVENAIKHGASTVGHSFVKIDIRVNGRELQFRSENSKPVLSKKVSGEVGGIGLKNIRRRLELLYPGKHELIINDETDYYQVNLKLIV